MVHDRLFAALLPNETQIKYLFPHFQLAVSSEQLVIEEFLYKINLIYVVKLILLKTGFFEHNSIRSDEM